MLLRHQRTDRFRDLVVEVHDPDATIADLAVALDPDLPPSPLAIDDRTVPAAAPLDRAGMAEGSVVARAARSAADASQATASQTTVSLIVVGGFDTGHRIDLAPGAHVLGRSCRAEGPPGAVWIEIDDPTVSGEHLRIDVDLDGSVVVTDLGSTNGSSLAGTSLTPRVATPWEPGSTLACGAAQLDLTRTHPAAQTATPPAAPLRNGTRPLHRRVRSGEAPPVEPVEIPPAPELPPPVTPIGLIAVAGSIAVGVVMVLVLGSLTYAIFALLGPVLLVANALDSKRRRRRTTRLARRRRNTQLQRLTSDLEAAADEARTARSLRFPGPAHAVSRAHLQPERLWERRPDHHDAFAVRIGTGEVPWEPLTSQDRAAWEPDVAEVLTAVGLGTTAVGVRLAAGEPIAVVGDPTAARAVVRSMLIQAVVDHGPADLAVSVLSASENRGAWGWCGWLPHSHDPGAGSLLAGDPESATRVAAELTAEVDGGPMRLVVIDDPAGLAARRGPVRSILRHATTGSRLVPLVIVATIDAVPASAAIVMTVTGDGTLTTTSDLASGPVMALGTGEATARDVARSLARFDDPEVADAGRGLPRSITMSGLLGSERLVGPVVGARWRAAPADPPPRALLGQGSDGPVEIDLAADGPHVLVAGTTGSGKSELLRTLVGSLALGSSPDHLAFVLIDFKGGSAFDACARLPHVTGVVTDLDDHLAARALRCLEAELHHRESILRRVGADDLATYRRITRGATPLPRLVVVIDEFATLAAELPDFVDALVGVAQRGRSLGVHLVLATQRPAGAVSDKIRANTALRIALRVHDRADSSDVIDVGDAADLPRQIPGRALVRFGPGELVAVQAALATARTTNDRPPITVAPLGVSTSPPAPPAGRSSADPVAPTDLERLVAATTEAWRALDGSAPRPVWPDPLPTDLPWPIRHPLAGQTTPTPTCTAPATLILGLLDDPDRQRQVPFAWAPDEGPLLIAGAPGSGASTALCTTALAVASAWPVSEAHLHAIDMGGGALRPLGDLAAVGQVVTADDDERQRRLIEDLAGLLAARRSVPCGWDGPRRFLVVDGVGALRDRWDPLEPTGTWDRFVEVVTRGTAFGIHVALAVEGPGAAPPNLVSACGQRLILRLGDRADFSAFGVTPASVPSLPAGRGVDGASGLVVQVGRPPAGLAAAIAEFATETGEHLPRPIEVLPESLPFSRLVARAEPLAVSGPDGSLELAMGIAESRLATARLALPPGGHALVAGPPRSGRSTALAVMARAVEEAGIPLLRVDGGAVIDADLLAALDTAGPLVVVIDDADRSADDHPLLSRLAAERSPHRHLLVAARTDRLRARYAHWTREVRVDRCGLLLAPDPDLDGELLATRLPRTWPVGPRPGLGWLVGGSPEGAVQLAEMPTQTPFTC